jgi:tRNA A22 N-methylase
MRRPVGSYVLRVLTVSALSMSPQSRNLASSLLPTFRAFRHRGIGLTTTSMRNTLIKRLRTDTSTSGSSRCSGGRSLIYDPIKHAVGSDVFSTVRRLSSSSTASSDSHCHDSDNSYNLKQLQYDEDHVIRAQEVVNSLATTGRTWKRLGPMVTLATRPYREAHCDGGGTTAHVYPDGTTAAAAADIGCDHGLLTYGLAASGCFESVVGVDVSEPALEHGGWALVEQLQEQLQEQEPIYDNDNKTKIQFVLGDGLGPLLNRRVDTICIAGMGVHTMIGILTPENLHRVHCQHIVLQPTNSRPRYLMLLYHHLIVNCGFAIDTEHISYLAKRWYLSTSFVLHKNKATTRTQGMPRTGSHHEEEVGSRRSTIMLPGCVLQNSDNEEQQRIYEQYVEHHMAWLRSDISTNSSSSRKDLDPWDQQWLDKMVERQQ